MKALQVSRSVAPHRPRPHRVGGVADRRDQARPAQLRGGRRTRAPRPRLAAGAHPSRGHLRVRPVARRGSCVAVLRRLGVVPVRPRPRGRRRTRRRHAGDPRTGARPRGSRLRSPVRRRRARRRRRLRPPRHRPSRTRHPDRVLLLDRRRLGADVRRPHLPAPPDPRRHARRAGRARRAARRRHPRRAALRTDDRRPPGHVRATDRRRARCRHDGPRGDRRTPPLPARRADHRRRPLPAATRAGQAARRRHRRRPVGTARAPCAVPPGATWSATTSARAHT